MSQKLEKFLEEAKKDLQKNKYGIGGMIGGIFGAGQAGKGERGARDAMSEALGLMSKVNVPTIEEQQIKLQMLKEAGLLTPEMEAAVQQDPAMLALITEDSRFKDAQLQGMQSLEARSRQGLGAEDRAALNSVRAGSAQQERGSRDAILQNMASRGMAGSGQELAAQLANSQASAQNASQQGDAIAAQASRNALQAITDRSSIANQARGADLQANSANANVKNAVQNFNTQLQSGQVQRNTGLRNNAQSANLANKQRVQDSNVDLANQQEMHNKALYQQKFENDLAKAGGMVNQLNKKGAMDSAQGYSRAGRSAAIGKSADESGQQVLQWAAMSDENVKKNVTDASGKLETFLNEIKRELAKNKHFEGGAVDPAALESMMQNAKFTPVAQGQDASKTGGMAMAPDKLPDTVGQTKSSGSSPDPAAILKMLFQGGGGAGQAQSTAAEAPAAEAQSAAAEAAFSATGPKRMQAAQYKGVTSAANPFGVRAYADGGLVQGEEIQPGDHEDNDIIPAALSAGEIVIPKSAVKGGRLGIDDFLDSAIGKEYEYKEPEKPMRGKGKHVSPMAQSLEKSELGRQMVIDTPEGKAIDYGKGFGTLLASQALLKEKIDEIEKKMKDKNRG